MESRNILIIVMACLVSPVWTTAWRSRGTVNCNALNRNPCQTFPGLCSEGRGLCVSKVACEFICVCPPDGRSGRDCISSSNTNSGTATNSQSFGTNSGGSSLDSLLVFPQDLFWDMNRVAKPGEVLRTTAPTDMTTTTPPLTKNRISTAKPKPTTTTAAKTPNAPSMPAVGTELNPVASPLLKSLLHTNTLTTTTQSTPTTKGGQIDTARTVVADTPTGRSDSSQVLASAVDAAAPKLLPNQDAPIRLSSMSASDRASMISNALKSQGDGTDSSAPSSLGLPRTNQNDQATTASTNSQQIIENVKSPLSSVGSGDSLLNPLSASGQNNQKMKDAPVAVDSQPVIDTAVAPLSQETTTTQKSPAAESATANNNMESTSHSGSKLPGQDNFPTFFGEAPRGSGSNTDKNGNAPLSVLVHRVYHPTEAFPTLKRRAH